MPSKSVTYLEEKQMSIFEIVLSYLAGGGAVGSSSFFALKAKIMEYLDRYGPGPVWGIFAVAIFAYPVSLMILALIIWGKQNEKKKLEEQESQEATPPPTQ